VFGGIWHHHRGERWAGDLCEQCLSPEERRLVRTPVEDLAVDRFVSEQLGGDVDPTHVIGEEPPEH
jgi:hypothetical protein